MMKTWSILASLAALIFTVIATPIPNAIADADADPEAKAQPPLGPPPPVVPAPVIEPVGPAQYQYQWEVSDPEGNNFYGHGERRDGAFTSGSYFVLLPDGRRQRVDYTVNGDEGFVATVSYD